MSGSKSSTDFCADDFGRSGTKTRPRSRATSASAIFAVRSTRSTAPVAMALLGMPS